MMRHLACPRAVRHLLALLALPALFFGMLRTAMAQAQDPLAEFKHILERRSPIPPPSVLDEKEGAKLEEERQKFYEERERALNKIVDTKLRTFGELRQALTLKEQDWGEPAGALRKEFPLDKALVDSNARVRNRIANKFRGKVHRIVEAGDDDSKAAIANLITEMGLTVRAVLPAKPQGTDAEIRADLRGGFARSMTDDVIRLAESPSEFVRLHALRALGGMNADPRKAAPALAKQLVPGNNVQVRRVAADSMLRIITIANYLKEQALGGVQVRADTEDVLIADAQVAQHAPVGLADADAAVRERAAESLHAAASALTARLQRPPEKATQLSKVSGLPKATGFTQAELDALNAALAAFGKAAPSIAAALADPNADVRAALARGLERLSDARYRLATDDFNTGFRAALKDRDPLSVFAKGEWRRVVPLLADPDVRVRRAAVNFFEFFPEARPAVVGDLTRALGDSDRFVRWGAARGIGYFTDKYQPRDAVPAVTALAKMLFDPDFAPRLAAAATLESLGKYAAGAVPDLARAIQFGDVENRVAALYIIQSIGPEPTKVLIPSVTEALKQGDARVRRTAAETLGTYGSLARDPATVAALRRAMGDDDQEVRINASEALLEILAGDMPRKL